MLSCSIFQRGSCLSCPPPPLAVTKDVKGAVYIIVCDIGLVCCWVPQESQQWIYIGLTFSETMYIYCCVIYGTDNGLYIYANVGSLKSPRNGYIYMPLVGHLYISVVGLFMVVIMEYIYISLSGPKSIYIDPLS